MDFFPALIKRHLHLLLGVWVWLFCLPSLLLAGWLFVSVYAALTQSIQNTARMVARHTLDTLDRIVFERRGDTLAFSGMPLVRALDTSRISDIADQAITAYAPYYRLVVVADRQGKIIGTNRANGAGQARPAAALLGRTVAGAPWFEETLRGSQPVLVEDFHVDPLVREVYRDDSPVMSFSAPIQNSAGEIVGVWSARMAREPLVEAVALVSRTYSSETPLPVVLRDRQGRELISIGQAQPRQSASEGRVRHDAAPVPLAAAASTGFADYSGVGWRILVYAPANEIGLPDVLLWLTAWLGLALVGGVLGLGWAVRRRVLRPLQALAREAHHLALEAQAPPPEDRSVTFAIGGLTPARQPRPPSTDTLSGLSKREDEIGELQRAFTTMAEQVQNRLACIRGLNAVSHALQKADFALPMILQLILETATRLTGARSGALGVFDETGEHLTQFITSGMDEATRQAIGVGLLGQLAHAEGVLRLKDLSQYPASVGFPPHHPPISSFLGCSIRAHSRLFGRIYLTDKLGPDGTVTEFTKIDEETITALAIHAGTAIENANLVTTIKATEAKYRLLLESAGEGVYGLDLQGCCTFINKTGAAMMGYQPGEVMGKNMHALIHHTRRDGSPYPQEECPIFGAFRTGRPSRCDTEVFWRRDGTSFPTNYSSYPILEDGIIQGAVVTITDITERRHLEEQLLRSQKIEAVGRLAGGIAHDFNNLLTAIMSYSDFLLTDLKAEDPRRQDAEGIKTAARQAASLTRQLLAFSRQQVLQPTVLDLNAVVSDTSVLLRRLIGENLELVTVLGHELGRVRADQGQIEQVLLNLSVNARDAMTQGGALTITTANVDVDDASLLRHQGILPGHFVTLAIKDTGCGMDAETQTHIFEPFFTTKNPGQGTGLGLATVYGIIKQSGGYIFVDSEPERGTTFTIYLPRVNEDLTKKEPSAPSGKQAAGTETILLAEDDTMVRAMVLKILRTANYTVLETQTPMEALSLAERHSAPIHLLLTDMVMPQMNGRELAERMQALRPDIAVLFMSGYTNEAIAPHGLLPASAAFLQKPFSPDMLIRKVRAVLDTPRKH